MILRFKKNPYSTLEKSLGYRFRNRSLLEEALTHRSFRFEHAEVECDNQRLEFLGDAWLGAVAAAYLYQSMEGREGVLTSLRSQCSSGQVLSRLADGIQLGDYLRIGKGEELSGGRKRPSNLADALESVLGAAYLDTGIKGVEKIFATLFVPLILSMTGDVWDKNPKGKLQALCQKNWKRSPVYRAVHAEGPRHAQVYTVSVELPNGLVATGKASSKREAEIAAAGNVLEVLHGDARWQDLLLQV